MNVAKSDYLMESKDEILRLEMKTDADKLKEQARWCGVESGMRILDAGCGPGITTALLHDMILPGGSAVGIDISEERINHARQQYGKCDTIEFHRHDIRDPLDDLGTFDIIWVRFVLEYFCKESLEIVENLKRSLKPGGCLCLLDLDNYNLNYYELPGALKNTLDELMTRLHEEYNFDIYSGRKLYSYLFDHGFECIDVNVIPHRLIYGDIDEEALHDWEKKAQVMYQRLRGVLDKYPGGYDAFYREFKAFFTDPRRFFYSSLVICKGMKPLE